MEPDRRRWLTDALAAIIVAGALCLRVATPWEAAAPPPDLRAFALMILMGALLLVRRRYPLGVLLASVAILLSYYALGYGAVGAVWPVAPALFNAALYGEVTAASISAGAIVLGSTAWRVFFEPEGNTLAVISDVLTEVFVSITVILSGAMVLNHRRLQAEVEAREKAIAAERDAVARIRLTEQRLHIAREIHDIVAHSLAAIGVQARVAEEALDSDTTEVKRSLRNIITTTSDAISQLRETVGGLRSGPTRPPTIESLVAAIPGVEVELEVEGEPTPADSEVESVIRAVVREALTNVVRHSGADHARVAIAYEPSSVRVVVADRGKGGHFTEGHGLAGMRERLQSVGGELVLGPNGESGFKLEATIPR
jgi:signal transduction histidine kinase